MAKVVANAQKVPTLESVTITLNVAETKRLTGILGKLNHGMYGLYSQLADILHENDLKADKIEQSVWRHCQGD